MSNETTVNEKLERVQTDHAVTCSKCGNVGKAFFPTDGNPEVKAWGEELVLLSAAVTLAEVLDELMKPTTIEGCDKGLALARDRVRCLMNPVAGVPDTAFDPPATPEPRP